MKYLLLYVFSFLFCCMYAQTELETVIDRECIVCVQCDSLYSRVCSDSIFVNPEQLAEFPGGTEALMIFLRKHLEYPPECKGQAIEGRVFIRFIIDESGKIICPYIYRSLHPAMDEEALRIVKLMPDWKPELNNNEACKSCFTLPIYFKM